MMRVVKSSRGDVHSIELTKEQASRYELVASSFHPLWYDRSHGWNGTAYLESYDFCKSVGKNNRVPCPYVAYCPLGEGYAPYGGVKDGEEWAPVSSQGNEWGEFAFESSIICTTALHSFGIDISNSTLFVSFCVCSSNRQFQYM